MLWFAPILQFALSTMRILLFVAMVASVLGSSHPAVVGRQSAEVRQVNRVLPGRFQKAGLHFGGKTGEIVGGAAGNALGTGASAVIGTVTGGNMGTKAGRSGMGAGLRITGEYVGSVCLAKLCGSVGRVADKFTKSGRQAQAAEKNRKKEQAEALKKPVLYNGGRYQQAKLSRTGSSPALLHKTATWQRKETTNPGGASTSGTKPAINKGKAPKNPGGASTSGTKPAINKGKAPMNAGGASTSGTKPARKGGEAPTHIVKSMRIGQTSPTLRKRKL
ncbi:unnamed protein product [Aphanomyces euteiches]